MEQYGNGPSTGLEQGAIDAPATGFTPADLDVAEDERRVLRELAGRVARIAAGPGMKETRRLWREHNMLRPTRPVVFCDPENGWNEIITESQMRCRGKIARRWEMSLRKEIFWGEEMGDDKPIDPWFNVNYTVSPEDWGVRPVYRRADRDGSYVWDSPIKDYDTDLKKLHPSEFQIDWETTTGCLELARELFSGVLRELMSIISRGILSKLPREDFHVPGGYHGPVRTVDMWGFTESQETVNVSPDMYGEFMFPYERPIMDRFGLTCYGCCEPIDPRWHVVQWCRIARAEADRIG